jgi:hypothetical protein
MIGVGARIRPTTMATIFALVLSSTSAVSQTIESAYTDLALDKCDTHPAGTLRITVSGVARALQESRSV